MGLEGRDDVTLLETVCNRLKDEAILTAERQQATQTDHALSGSNAEGGYALPAFNRQNSNPITEESKRNVSSTPSSSSSSFSSSSDIDASPSRIRTGSYFVQIGKIFQPKRSYFNNNKYTRSKASYEAHKTMTTLRHPLVHTSGLVRVLEAMGVAIGTQQPILIDGSAASGKTASVHELARLCEQRLLVVDLHRDSTHSDLIGRWVPEYTAIDTKLQRQNYLATLELGFSLVVAPRTKEMLRFNPYYALAVAKILLIKQKHIDVLARFATSSRVSGQDPVYVKEVEDAICTGLGFIIDIGRKTNGKEGANLTEDMKEVIREVSMMAKDVLLAIQKESNIPLSSISRVSEQEERRLGLKFVYGPLIQAMREGAWLLIDSVNAAQPHVIERLLSLLEDKPTFKLIEDGSGVTYARRGYGLSRGGTITQPIHEDFRIFLCVDSSRANSNRLSSALLNRVIKITTRPLDLQSDDVMSMLSDHLTSLYKRRLTTIRSSRPASQVPDRSISSGVTYEITRISEAVTKAYYDFKACAAINSQALPAGFTVTFRTARACAENVVGLLLRGHSFLAALAVGLVSCFVEPFGVVEGQSARERMLMCICDIVNNEQMEVTKLKESQSNDERTVSTSTGKPIEVLASILIVIRAYLSPLTYKVSKSATTSQNVLLLDDDEGRKLLPDYTIEPSQILGEIRKAWLSFEQTIARTSAIEVKATATMLRDVFITHMSGSYLSRLKAALKTLSADPNAHVFHPRAPHERIDVNALLSYAYILNDFVMAAMEITDSLDVMANLPLLRGYNGTLDEDGHELTHLSQEQRLHHMLMHAVLEGAMSIPLRFSSDANDMLVHKRRSLFDSLSRSDQVLKIGSIELGLIQLEARICAIQAMLARASQLMVSYQNDTHAKALGRIRKAQESLGEVIENAYIYAIDKRLREVSHSDKKDALSSQEAKRDSSGHQGEGGGVKMVPSPPRDDALVESQDVIRATLSSIVGKQAYQTLKTEGVNLVNKTSGDTAYLMSCPLGILLRVLTKFSNMKAHLGNKPPIVHDLTFESDVATHTKAIYEAFHDVVLANKADIAILAVPLSQSALGTDTGLLVIRRHSRHPISSSSAIADGHTPSAGPPSDVDCVLFVPADEVRALGAKHSGVIYDNRYIDLANAAFHAVTTSISTSSSSSSPTYTPTFSSSSSSFVRVVSVGLREDNSSNHAGINSQTDSIELIRLYNTARTGDNQLMFSSAIWGDGSSAGVMPCPYMTRAGVSLLVTLAGLLKYLPSRSLISSISRTSAMNTNTTTTTTTVTSTSPFPATVLVSVNDCLISISGTHFRDSSEFKGTALLAKQLLEAFDAYCRGVDYRASKLSSKPDQSISAWIEEAGHPDIHSYLAGVLASSVHDQIVSSDMESYTLMSQARKVMVQMISSSDSALTITKLNQASKAVVNHRPVKLWMVMNAICDHVPSPSNEQASLPGYPVVAKALQTWVGLYAEAWAPDSREGRSSFDERYKQLHILLAYFLKGKDAIHSQNKEEIDYSAFLIPSQLSKEEVVLVITSIGDLLFMVLETIPSSSARAGIRNRTLLEEISNSQRSAKQLDKQLAEVLSRLDVNLTNVPLRDRCTVSESALLLSVLSGFKCPNEKEAALLLGTITDIRIKTQKEYDNAKVLLERVLVDAASHHDQLHKSDVFKYVSQKNSEHELMYHRYSDLSTDIHEAKKQATILSANLDRGEAIVRMRRAFTLWFMAISKVSSCPKDVISLLDELRPYLISHVNAHTIIDKICDDLSGLAKPDQPSVYKHMLHLRLYLLRTAQGLITPLSPNKGNSNNHSSQSEMISDLLTSSGKGFIDVLYKHRSLAIFLDDTGGDLSTTTSTIVLLPLCTFGFDTPLLEKENEVKDAAQGEVKANVGDIDDAINKSFKQLDTSLSENKLDIVGQSQRAEGADELRRLFGADAFGSAPILSGKDHQSLGSLFIKTSSLGKLFKWSDNEVSDVKYQTPLRAYDEATLVNGACLQVSKVVNTRTFASDSLTVSLRLLEYALYWLRDSLLERSPALQRSIPPLKPITVPLNEVVFVAKRHHIALHIKALINRCEAYLSSLHASLRQRTECLSSIAFTDAVLIAECLEQRRLMLSYYGNIFCSTLARHNSVMKAGSCTSLPIPCNPSLDEVYKWHTETVKNYVAMKKDHLPSAKTELTDIEHLLSDLSHQMTQCFVSQRLVMAIDEAESNIEDRVDTSGNQALTWADVIESRIIGQTIEPLSLPSAKTAKLITQQLAEATTALVQQAVGLGVERKETGEGKSEALTLPVNQQTYFEALTAAGNDVKSGAKAILTMIRGSVDQLSRVIAFADKNKGRIGDPIRQFIGDVIAELKATTLDGMTKSLKGGAGKPFLTTSSRAITPHLHVHKLISAGEVPSSDSLETSVTEVVTRLDSTVSKLDTLRTAIEGVVTNKYHLDTWVCTRRLPIYEWDRFIVAARRDYNSNVLMNLSCRRTDCMRRVVFVLEMMKIGLALGDHAIGTNLNVSNRYCSRHYEVINLEEHSITLRCGDHIVPLRRGLSFGFEYDNDATHQVPITIKFGDYPSTSTIGFMIEFRSTSKEGGLVNGIIKLTSGNSTVNVGHAILTMYSYELHDNMCNHQQETDYSAWSHVIDEFPATVEGFNRISVIGQSNLCPLVNTAHNALNKYVEQTRAIREDLRKQLKLWYLKNNVAEKVEWCPEAYQRLDKLRGGTVTHVNYIDELHSLLSTASLAWIPRGERERIFMLTDDYIRALRSVDESMTMLMHKWIDIVIVACSEIATDVNTYEQLSSILNILQSKDIINHLKTMPRLSALCTQTCSILINRRDMLKDIQRLIPPIYNLNYDESVVTVQSDAKVLNAFMAASSRFVIQDCVTGSNSPPFKVTPDQPKTQAQAESKDPASSTSPSTEAGNTLSNEGSSSQSQPPVALTLVTPTVASRDTAQAFAAIHNKSSSIYSIKVLEITDGKRSDTVYSEHIITPYARLLIPLAATLRDNEKEGEVKRYFDIAFERDGNHIINRTVALHTRFINITTKTYPLCLTMPIVPLSQLNPVIDAVINNTTTIPRQLYPRISQCIVKLASYDKIISHSSSNSNNNSTNKAIDSNGGMIIDRLFTIASTRDYCGDDEPLEPVYIDNPSKHLNKGYRVLQIKLNTDKLVKALGYTPTRRGLEGEYRCTIDLGVMDDKGQPMTSDVVLRVGEVKVDIALSTVLPSYTQEEKQEKVGNLPAVSSSDTTLTSPRLLFVDNTSNGLSALTAPITNVVIANHSLTDVNVSVWLEGTRLVLGERIYFINGGKGVKQAQVDIPHTEAHAQSHLGASRIFFTARPGNTLIPVSIFSESKVKGNEDESDSEWTIRASVNGGVPHKLTVPKMTVIKCRDIKHNIKEINAPKIELKADRNGNPLVYEYRDVVIEGNYTLHEDLPSGGPKLTDIVDISVQNTRTHIRYGKATQGRCCSVPLNYVSKEGLTYTLSAQITVAYCHRAPMNPVSVKDVGGFVGEVKLQCRRQAENRSLAEYTSVKTIIFERMLPPTVRCQSLKGMAVAPECKDVPTIDSPVVILRFPSTAPCCVQLFKTANKGAARPFTVYRLDAKGKVVEIRYQEDAKTNPKNVPPLVVTKSPASSKVAYFTLSHIPEANQGFSVCIPFASINSDKISPAGGYRPLSLNQVSATSDMKYTDDTTDVPSDWLVLSTPGYGSPPSIALTHRSVTRALSATKGKAVGDSPNNQLSTIDGLHLLCSFETEQTEKQGGSEGTKTKQSDTPQPNKSLPISNTTSSSISFQNISLDTTNLLSREDRIKSLKAKIGTVNLWRTKVNQARDDLVYCFVPLNNTLATLTSSFNAITSRSYYLQLKKSQLATTPLPLLLTLSIATGETLRHCIDLAYDIFKETLLVQRETSKAKESTLFGKIITAVVTTMTSGTLPITLGDKSILSQATRTALGTVAYLAQVITAILTLDSTSEMNLLVGGVGDGYSTKEGHLFTHLREQLREIKAILTALPKEMAYDEYWNDLFNMLGCKPTDQVQLDDQDDALQRETEREREHVSRTQELVERQQSKDAYDKYKANQRIEEKRQSNQTDVSLVSGLGVPHHDNRQTETTSSGAQRDRTRINPRDIKAMEDVITKQLEKTKPKKATLDSITEKKQEDAQFNNPADPPTETMSMEVEFKAEDVAKLKSQFEFSSGNVDNTTKYKEMKEAEAQSMKRFKVYQNLVSSPSIRDAVGDMIQRVNTSLSSLSQESLDRQLQVCLLVDVSFSMGQSPRLYCTIACMMEALHRLEAKFSVITFASDYHIARSMNTDAELTDSGDMVLQSVISNRAGTNLPGAIHQASNQGFLPPPSGAQSPARVVVVLTDGWFPQPSSVHVHLREAKTSLYVMQYGHGKHFNIPSAATVVDIPGSSSTSLSSSSSSSLLHTDSSLQALKALHAVLTESTTNEAQVNARPSSPDTNPSPLSNIITNDLALFPELPIVTTTSNNNNNSNSNSNSNTSSNNTSTSSSSSSSSTSSSLSSSSSSTPTPSLDDDATYIPLLVAAFASAISSAYRRVPEMSQSNPITPTTSLHQSRFDIATDAKAIYGLDENDAIMCLEGYEPWNTAPTFSGTSLCYGRGDNVPFPFPEDKTQQNSDNSVAPFMAGDINRSHSSGIPLQPYGFIDSRTKLDKWKSSVTSTITELNQLGIRNLSNMTPNNTNNNNKNALNHHNLIHSLITSWTKLISRLETAQPPLDEAIDQCLFPIGEQTRVTGSRQGTKVYIPGVLKSEITRGACQDLFERRQGGGIRKQKIGMLIDQSISMSGESILHAIQGVCALSRSLDRIEKTDYAIYAFGEEFRVIKDPGDRLDVTQKVMLMLSTVTKGKKPGCRADSTKDALAIDVALSLLTVGGSIETGDDTTLFVFTDGYSSMPGQLRQIQRYYYHVGGVRIIAVGLGPTASPTVLQSCYHQYITAPNVFYLGDALKRWHEHHLQPLPLTHRSSSLNSSSSSTSSSSITSPIPTSWLQIWQSSMDEASRGLDGQSMVAKIKGRYSKKLKAVVDFAIVMDATASMKHYREPVINGLTKLVSAIDALSKKSGSELNLRIGFVLYRDVSNDEANGKSTSYTLNEERFTPRDFVTVTGGGDAKANRENLMQWIRAINCAQSVNEDCPEDVFGGLNYATTIRGENTYNKPNHDTGIGLLWEKPSQDEATRADYMHRVLMWIGDAPMHGQKYCHSQAYDRYKAFDDAKNPLCFSTIEQTFQGIITSDLSGQPGKHIPVSIVLAPLDVYYGGEALVKKTTDALEAEVKRIQAKISSCGTSDGKEDNETKSNCPQGNNHLMIIRHEPCRADVTSGINTPEGGVACTTDSYAQTIQQVLEHVGASISRSITEQIL